MHINIQWYYKTTLYYIYKLSYIKFFFFSKTPRSEFYKYEEQFEKYTTLMYRPPEMCDLYQGYTVDEKVDVWMLGCVLYTICFYVHPFIEC